MFVEAILSNHLFRLRVVVPIVGVRMASCTKLVVCPWVQWSASDSGRICCSYQCNSADRSLHGPLLRSALNFTIDPKPTTVPNKPRRGVRDGRSLRVQTASF